jgi:hypothetical protein
MSSTMFAGEVAVDDVVEVEEAQAVEVLLPQAKEDRAGEPLLGAVVAVAEVALEVAAVGEIHHEVERAQGAVLVLLEADGAERDEALVVQQGQDSHFQVELHELFGVEGGVLGPALEEGPSDVDPLDRPGDGVELDLEDLPERART